MANPMHMRSKQREKKVLSFLIFCSKMFFWVGFDDDTSLGGFANPSVNQKRETKRVFGLFLFFLKTINPDHQTINFLFTADLKFLFI